MLALWASWLLVPWSLGSLVQARTSATRRAREDLAARAALQERVRITGEVHDVAGHGFSAVAMQAGVALLVFDEQPAQARRCLESIKSTSDEALADLRTILDDSREPGAEGGLDGLARLAERTRTAGVPVQLSVSAPSVPADVGGAVFGVVREALTNVLRHAGSATATVGVRVAGEELEVEVLDDGAGGAVAPDGAGISGMRNRVEALGGELSAKPRAGRGFRVLARIPLPGSAR
nr:histidine kinase [Saccharopolyspora sp. HNM0983]